MTGPSVCSIEELAAKYPTRIVSQGGGAYLAQSNIYTELGGTLLVHGSGAGGSVAELRLLSNNTGGANDVVQINADYGTIDIRGTLVTSWDTAAAGPDTEYGATLKRAYIRARTQSASAESTMNVIDSEIQYLGYDGSEAYGLTWKVLNGDYANADVFGDVIGNNVHHLYFGFYSYGAESMDIVDNEFANNVQYGIDPHDDSDRLNITDNWSHDNGNHGIICSQRCNEIVISGNTVEDNAGHGIMIHREVEFSTVSDNIVRNNGDAGIALFESFDNVIENNVLSGNANSLRLSVGSSRNVFRNNTVESSTNYGIYMFSGSDVPQRPGNDGRNRDNVFEDNVVTASATQIAKMTDSPDNTFTGNDFTGHPGSTNKWSFTASTPTNAATLTVDNDFDAGVVLSGI